MSRLSKPETADRATVNKESLVSPKNNLVSPEAKNSMKDNFQKDKEKADNSKPSNESLKKEKMVTFEEDTNHTEYTVEEEEKTTESSTEETLNTGTTTSTITVQNDQIYDESEEGPIGDADMIYDV